jgi:hypothetical protein
MPLAEGLSAVAGVRDRIEILEIGQFLSTNAQALGLFAAKAATAALERIVDRYNIVIDSCENDPSLRIAR